MIAPIKQPKKIRRINGPISSAIKGEKLLISYEFLC
jgi:hypothetical protein